MLRVREESQKGSGAANHKRIWIREVLLPGVLGAVRVPGNLWQSSTLQNRLIINPSCARI